jgi:hypothetical protein
MDLLIIDSRAAWKAANGKARELLHTAATALSLEGK